MKKLKDVLNLQEQEKTTISGDLALCVSRANEILSMADDIYNTLSELETIDQESQIAIEKRLCRFR